MERIETERLILRPFTESDYDDLFEFLYQLRDNEYEGYPGITYENGWEHFKYRLHSEEFYAPLAYPGYDWLSMAVSDLSAVGAPSAALAEQLNALFGPCAVVSIMAVCVESAGCKSKLLKTGKE